MQVLADLEFYVCGSNDKNIYILYTLFIQSNNVYYKKLSGYASLKNFEIIKIFNEFLKVRFLKLIT